MNLAIILALAALWLYWAGRAFMRGDFVMAGILVVVGVLITISRLKSRGD